MTCPYCGNSAAYCDSSIVYRGQSYGMIWLCNSYPDCDAYVGAHPSGHPKGRLAKKDLREWKMKAHSSIDWMWKSGMMERTEVYKLVQDLMGMTESDAHIGKWDIPTCRRLVETIIGGAKYMAVRNRMHSVHQKER